MARRDEKPMMPVAVNRTPCAGRSDCRFPGLLWMSNLSHDQRLCINHYYTALEENPSLRDDPTVPPKHHRMAGVQPKQVAGAD